MTADSNKIDVFRQAERLWTDIHDDFIENCLAQLIKDYGIHSVSIVLADNDFVQNLNRQYRHKDKPTNVLSFPAENNPDGAIGDIILAHETIEQEATVQNKSFKDHVMHMLIHGCLHLLGFDHETDEEAKEMESLEIEALTRLNIKNPYEIWQDN